MIAGGRDIPAGRCSADPVAVHPRSPVRLALLALDEARAEDRTLHATDVVMLRAVFESDDPVFREALMARRDFADDLQTASTVLGDARGHYRLGTAEYRFLRDLLLDPATRSLRAAPRCRPDPLLLVQEAEAEKPLYDMPASLVWCSIAYVFFCVFLLALIVMDHPVHRW